jgi:hypothetical protein
MDLSEILAQFTFLELLLIASIGFLILIAILSIYRYKKKEEKLILLIRHITGFSIGFLDQTIMIIFNFQSGYELVVILFDYSAYCLWFMLMPNLLESKKKNILIPLWIIISAAINTIFEHTSLILVTGSLQYPTEPIVWTSFHTVIFYLGMHTLGALIILYGFKRIET